ncbi:hypothetical protein [uncultured Sphingomonas sp.]|uniref:hypothetical protein n=1 Tax=uncultured Sphingomonas sp. TaxID=158754 RepID=UPI0025F1ABE7|nr:hypothetical protein [uncultured Sphingomonas sp.]
MPRLLTLAAAAVAAVTATSLPAQGADQDVRCLMASNLFSQAEKDPTRKQVALVSSFFYMGRLDGRVTPAQLKAQILAQGKTLTTKNAGETMTACAKNVQGKQALIQGIGKQLAAQTRK